MTCTNQADCLQVLKILTPEVSRVKLVEIADLELQQHLVKFERAQG
jgi:hypothetical protein